MKFLLYVGIIVLVLIVLLAIVYFALLFKLKNINSKVYKYNEEENLKDNNVLIIYQPSRHKTIQKIVDKIKKNIVEMNFGYRIHTLSKQYDDYNEYKFVIFVVPVYFGEIHEEFINKISRVKIKNLLIVYNGLNNNSSNEDRLVNEKSLSKYKKIKLHTTDIDNVNDFIKKEVK
jgi:hypothetical protein